MFAYIQQRMPNIGINIEKSNTSKLEISKIKPLGGILSPDITSTKSLNNYDISNSGQIIGRFKVYGISGDNVLKNLHKAVDCESNVEFVCKVCGYWISCYHIMKIFLKISKVFHQAFIKLHSK